MYYKVMKNGDVVDVLDNVVYLRYQVKHDRMVLCDKQEAQAISSSDGKTIWHEVSLRGMPIDGYDTVRLEEIDESEYRRLKIFNGDTPEMVVDRFVKSVLVDKETGQLVESLRRLYLHQKIDKSKVIELCNSGKITSDQMERVLGNQYTLPFYLMRTVKRCAPLLW